MAEKLLPCPFCGGEAFMTCDNDGYFYVKCDGGGDCRAESGHYITNVQAENYWNTRSVDVAACTIKEFCINQSGNDEITCASCEFGTCCASEPYTWEV